MACDPLPTTQTDTGRIEKLNKTPQRVEYYLMHSGATLTRVIGGWGACLDRSGQWISHPSVARHAYGIGGDADAEPITREQAQEWVAKNRPGVSVEWL